MRILARFGSLAALAALAFGSGCYARAEPAYVTSAEVGVGYEPAYYDGYLVYYDSDGRPFYYDPGGAVVWIEPTSPYYGGLVNHYRVYGRAYPRWYQSYGYRYRGYRQAAPGYHYYRGYHVARPAPAGRRR